MATSTPVRHRLRRVLLILLALMAVLAIAAFIVFKSTPWPSAMAIRWLFERDGAATNATLGAHVPAGVSSESALRYDPDDPVALLDIHRPQTRDDRALPVLVWIHGGGFVAGNRGDVRNYARILAAGGFAVATVDYSLAPEVRYPVPVEQVNRALAYLSGNAERLKLDPDRIVLGGDSAGAQLAAQVAALASSPDYAGSSGLRPGIARNQLRGVVLFCGPHNARMMADRVSSSWFVRTVMWSYLGSTEPSPALLDEFSVVPHVTATFPPAFISVGNDDPLAPQSYALADALEQQGVRVETLFYPPEHTPKLGHEYQFDLTRPEARDALNRTRAFLHGVVRH